MQGIKLADAKKKAEFIKNPKNKNVIKSIYCGLVKSPLDKKMLPKLPADSQNSVNEDKSPKKKKTRNKSATQMLLQNLGNHIKGIS